MFKRYIGYKHTHKMYNNVFDKLPALYAFTNVAQLVFYLFIYHIKFSIFIYNDEITSFWKIFSSHGKDACDDT